MIRDYLTVAFRNIIRQPGYSAINVIGLTIGMSCAVLIGTFVFDEVRYTMYHEDSHRIYRVLSVWKEDTGTDRITTGIVDGFTNRIKAEIPEIEYATRLSQGWGIPIDTGNGLPINQGSVVLDADGFKMFGFKLLRGDLSEVEKTYAVFLAESSSRRVFGEEDPVGKQFTAEGRFTGGEYVVAGVIADMERHSSLNVDVVRGSMRFWGLNEEDNRGGLLGWWEDWILGQGWRPVGSFIKLQEGTDPG